MTAVLLRGSCCGDVWVVSNDGEDITDEMKTSGIPIVYADEAEALAAMSPDARWIWMERKLLIPGMHFTTTDVTFAPGTWRDKL